MVPTNWVIPNVSENPSKKNSHLCWWPSNGSPDETTGRMSMLVSNCSEPNYETWRLQIGVKFEDFVDFDKAQSVLRLYTSQITTSEDEYRAPPLQPCTSSPKNSLSKKSTSGSEKASSKYGL